MKNYQIREMSTEEIKKRILEEEKNLVDLRFQLELKNLTNTAKIRNTKKDIARMKTILKERELQEAKTSKESK
ncbi:MAG: 50S ribosomal protein L29 [Stygiobacter sp.]|jgi:large subunit ribosomal protein L29|uniref:Large ribosomal subunit protein uL29 n=1 Tax=Stygiobacter electus TaxID=3032292 RepID=A0AAE3NYB1_9BACT|nr:50S ribosomal protein L29 [Stygiobacter electus]MDF1611009.1 50S ribosomal protein L29 [Stygiobacter electus]